MVRSYVAAGVVGLLVGTGLLFAKSHSHRKFVSLLTSPRSPCEVDRCSHSHTGLTRPR